MGVRGQALQGHQRHAGCRGQELDLPSHRHARMPCVGAERLLNWASVSQSGARPLAKGKQHTDKMAFVCQMPLRTRCHVPCGVAG
jgi:hypothetical protein